MAGETGKVPTSASDRDDDFSPGVSFSEIAECFGGLAEPIRPVYDRCHLSGLGKLSQERKILCCDLGDEEGHPLATAQRLHNRSAEVRQRSEPSIRHRSADQDGGRLGCQDPSERKERAASGDVEHQVVTLSALLDLTYHAYHIIESYIMGYTSQVLSYRAVDMQKFEDLAESFRRGTSPSNTPTSPSTPCNTWSLAVRKGARTSSDST